MSSARTEPMLLNVGKPEVDLSARSDKKVQTTLNECLGDCGAEGIVVTEPYTIEVRVRLTIPGRGYLKEAL